MYVYIYIYIYIYIPTRERRRLVGLVQVFDLQGLSFWQARARQIFSPEPQL